MTIGDIAAETGVPASTIRYWERSGLGCYLDPHRRAGNAGIHGSPVHRLAVLRLAQACGFRLAEMRFFCFGAGRYT
jgi:DNA-binding transcriptional MerR regulator